MYNTAGIEHWITVSEPTCDDEDGPRDRTGAETKRSCSRPDTEPSISSDRSSVEYRKMGPAFGINTGINLRAFRDSDVDGNALLGFKDLVNKIMAFAEGVGTVPAELQVGFAWLCSS
jgi:hypothetical protein